MDSSHLLTRMKHFVKSSDSPASSVVQSGELKSVSKVSFISGSHVKQFYEKTVGEEALETKPLIRRTDVSPVKKPSSGKITKKPFNINSLMKAIEVGSSAEVVAMLEDNTDHVNCRDQFGWTPLMTACCAGDENIVRVLLQRRPDLTVCDKRGNSCRTLALAKGHQNIVSVLNEYMAETKKASHSDHRPKEPDESEKLSSFYCKVCKQTVENSTFKKHLSSTIHNFNYSSKRKMPTMYGIPESNKGFQILVRSGWNKEEGLGPSGEGHKFPPKTILKQDKSGLGAKKYKARVTHTLENARRDAKPKDTFKRNLKSQLIKEKRHQRNLRRMLS